MNFERRKEILIKTIQYVSQEFGLPSAIKYENSMTVVQVGTCKESKDCIAVYNVDQLVEKYSMVTDENIWIQQMYDMFTRMIRDSIEDKKDPDYMKNILTTFSKHERYFVEKLPRSQYWLNTWKGQPGLLTSTIDGAQCVWSIGSDTNSNYLTGAIVDHFTSKREDALKHLAKRWEKDLENHPQEVRVFPANVIVGMESNNGVSITQERLAKIPLVMNVIHGPRIFELMTYAPSCKAVLNFLNLKIDKLTVFGLTQDLCFIEPTDKKEELKTTPWDRELLGRKVIDPNNYKRFDIFLEHKGTSFDLSKVKPLKLQLKEFKDQYFIPYQKANIVYEKDGSVMLY